MDSTNALVRAVDQPALDTIAEPLGAAIRQAYSRAGDAGQVVKNAMHGVWLGHPLHPVFTDIPIGAWTTALALDAASNGDRGMRVRLEAANFDSLVTWLAGLQQQYGVGVESASIDRTEKSGIVNASLVLTRA